MVGAAPAALRAYLIQLLDEPVDGAGSGADGGVDGAADATGWSVPDEERVLLDSGPRHANPPLALAAWAGAHVPAVWRGVEVRAGGPVGAGGGRVCVCMVVVVVVIY